MINNKKGLSTVVTTLIIILLVLVAIGIIWVVIRGIVEGGASNVDYQTKCLNVDIRPTAVNGCPACTGVVVTRTAGGESIAGVAIVYKNTTGSSSVTYTTGDIPPLTTATLSASSGSLVTPNKVEVSAYFVDASGARQICSQPGSYSF